MTIAEPRAAHYVNGQWYLAEPEVTLAEHRRGCAYKYGNLRGVEFRAFPAGTNFFVPGYMQPHRGGWPAFMLPDESAK